MGAILAGGQSRRFGGCNKSWIELGGRPLISHVFERVGKQVTWPVVNAPDGFDPNEDEDGEGSFIRVPDITESGRLEDFSGPMIGILSVLEWAAQSRGYGWVATFPTDTPFLPTDFVVRALEALNREGADLACAESGGRVHPVIGLWPVELVPALRQAVVDDGLRRAKGVLERFKVARVSYPTTPIDPFFNINTRGDLAEAERLLAVMG